MGNSRHVWSRTEELGHGPKMESKPGQEVRQGQLAGSGEHPTGGKGRAGELLPLGPAGCSSRPPHQTQGAYLGWAPEGAALGVPVPATHSHWALYTQWAQLTPFQ